MSRTCIALLALLVPLIARGQASDARARDMIAVEARVVVGLGAPTGATTAGVLPEATTAEGIQQLAAIANVDATLADLVAAQLMQRGIAGTLSLSDTTLVALLSGYEPSHTLDAVITVTIIGPDGKVIRTTTMRRSEISQVLLGEVIGMQIAAEAGNGVLKRNLGHYYFYVTVSASTV